MVGVVDSLGWLGLSTEDVGSDYLPLMPLFGSSDVGVTGLDLPPFETSLNRGSRNGAVGGASWAGAATLQARLVPCSNQRLLELRQSMKNRVRPDDEQPLTFTGMAFPGTQRIYARPTLCQFKLTAPTAHGEVHIVDCAWTSTDGLVYDDEQTVQTFGTVTPVASYELEVTNDGLETGEGGRALELRVTAQTTLVAPVVRIDHADATFESVSFPDLTMTAGQVLTFRDDNLPRVGSRIVNGYMRTTTDVASGSRHGRLWQFPPGDSDVTISATSGTFSGFVKTRSVW